MKNQMRIILAGGGTAGHVLPLIEIARELKKRGHKVIYIGSGNPERRLVKIVKFKQIQSGKWRRYFSLQNFIDILKVCVGIFQARSIIKRLKPNAVLIKGGYVSLPVVIGSYLTNIPLYAHESDVVLGWANGLAAYFARTIFVGFPVDNYPVKLRSKMIYTGTPVRTNHSHASVKQFGFSKNLPIVLVTGGSQGARGINELVFGGLKDLLQTYQIIHITGSHDFNRAIEARNRLPFHLKDRYSVYKFLEEDFMDGLKVADVVITRGGATSLAEIASMKKRAIVVPLPTAASDHQRKNAEVYQKLYGFSILEQYKSKASDLARTVNAVLQQEPPAAQTPKSAEVIVKELTKL